MQKNLYFNDYRLMLGTIFSNTNHEYIQLPKYYDIIARLKTKPMMGYAMTLHHHLSGAMCNRKPSPRKDICLYIENEKGRITNKDEMEKFLSEEGYLKNNGAYLLNLASSATWYSTLKNLLDIGLLDLSGGKLKSMIPIEGRFLPIPYAYVAFLSRLKRDSNIKNSISEKLSKIPEELTNQLQSFNKDDLVKEIVNLRTKDLKIHNKSELFKSLYSEIKKEFPHKWGRPSEAESNANSFLDKVLEKIPSLDSDTLDSIKIAQKQADTEYKEKIQTLKIDPEMTHAFEVDVSPKVKAVKAVKGVPKDVTSPQAAKFYGAVIEPDEPTEPTEPNEKIEFEAHPETEAEEVKYDIFGIQIDQPQNEIESDSDTSFDPNEFWK